MKKLFVSFLICTLFLFSCSLSMTSGSTELVISLPGNGTKTVSKYVPEDVSEYKIDLIDSNGITVTKSGIPGAVVLFDNISGGSYTVKILAFDSNSYVAARGTTSVQIIQNEKNHLVAEAILQNKATDYFVSVPKGVWNSNHKEYFRNSTFYNAVKDVEYGCEEMEEIAQGQNCTWAQIINPEVEYAYLNLFMDEESGWKQIAEGADLNFNLLYKTEKKSVISVTILDALREDYGYTKFVEYDPDLNESFASIQHLMLKPRTKGMKPFVRIGFSKDCGKISVLKPELRSSMGNPGLLDNSVIPSEKEIVKLDNTGKFTFNKNNSKEGYSAALFTGMQIEKDKLYTVTITNLKADKNVQNVKISARSFASKKELFVSSTEGFSLTADTPKTVLLLVPGILVYENDYEGAYIEIIPEGYEGDEVTLSAQEVSYSISGINGLSNPIGCSVLLTDFEDLPSFNTNHVPVYMEGTANYSEYEVMLNPGETKYFNVEVIPATNDAFDYIPSEDPKFYYTSLETGKVLKNKDYEEYYIPLFINTYIGNNSKDTDCKRLSDGRYVIKNLSEYEKFVKIRAEISGISVNDGKTFIEKNESYTNPNLIIGHKFVENIQLEGQRCKAKLISFPGSFFVPAENSSFSKIKIGQVKCIPVAGSVDTPVKFSENGSPSRLNGDPRYIVEVKTKSGELICSDEIYNLRYEDGFSMGCYRFVGDKYHNYVSQERNSLDDYLVLQNPSGSFNRDDIVLNLYFSYFSSIEDQNGVYHDVSNEKLDVYFLQLDVKYE